MKKILILCLFILVTIPMVDAAYFFENPMSEKTMVFVSRYSSTSMDLNTLDYYKKVKDNFSVYIIQDSSVAENKAEWRDAYQNSDLIFVISLSNPVLNNSRNNFCGNLSVVLNKTKGIVFAGNSSISSLNYMGCPYTPYFNLATPSDNTDVIAREVNITRNHRITTGYSIGKYNLSSEGLVYTVKSPIDGMSLGIADDYSFLTIWEGMSYRAGVWGIDTSSLTGCTNCLGWNLFYQLLDWVSNTSDMGFKIQTDKDVYTQGEIIHIAVTAPVDISSISGNIIDPQGVDYGLFFSGSGKVRESNYLLEDDDPNGNYTIDILADNVEKTKDVLVKSFYLNLTIINQTEEVKVYVKVTNLSGNDVNNVNVTINITAPTGSEWSKSYDNIGSVYETYNVSRSGRYKVYAEAVDQYGRKDYKIEYFSFFKKPNITFSPDNITESVTEPGIINYTLIMINEGEESLTNVNVTKTGEISNWIMLEKMELPNILPGEYKILRFNITVPDVEKRIYTGGIKVTYDQGKNELPITINIKYTGDLYVNPPSWKGWLVLGESKTIEFKLKNSGVGEVIIESIEVTGSLMNNANIIEQPSKIDPGETETLKVQVTTSGIALDDLTETVYGNLEITTDLGIYYPFISLELTVVKNLETEVNSLSVEIDDMENDITKLDDSDLRTDLEDIKTGLEEVKTLFAQGEYEDAVSSFRSIKSDIDDLRLRITEKQKEIAGRKSGFIRNIIVFLSLVIIVVIGFFFVKKLRRGKKYEWLYEKWKSSTSRTILLI